MKLNDILLTEADWNDEQIEKWLKQMKIENYKIRGDKTVDVDGDVDLFNRKIDAFPIKFGRVTGHFMVRHNNFSSLAGFPSYVGGDLSISHNSKIKSFAKGNGMVVGGNVMFNGTNITTLEGISDAFSEINGQDGNFSLDSIHYHIKTGGIGLILIKNISPEISSYAGGDFAKAYTIIQTYLGKPDEVFECQNELIAANLEPFSRL